MFLLFNKLSVWSCVSFNDKQFYNEPRFSTSTYNVPIKSFTWMMTV